MTWRPTLQDLHPREQNLLDTAYLQARDFARGLSTPVDLAYVTCSYDTGFTPLQGQILGKISQLRDVWGDDSPVRWSLWIVDDKIREEGWREQVEDIFAMAPCADLLAQGRLHCVPLRRTLPDGQDRKGQAILEGMEAASRQENPPQAFVYINLNLKVHAGLSVPGVVRVLDGDVDVAVGSRAEVDGGLVLGAGALGRSKSIAFNKLVVALLPELADYEDTNAPMKVFTPEAARFLCGEATMVGVTLDIEWLTMLHRRGFRLRRFPVVWRQRAGSKPPWHLIPASVAAIVKVKNRWGT